MPWHLNKKRGKTHLDFSVSEYITAAGEFELTVRYLAGRHALKIHAVELFEGEKKVAEDVHEGYAGRKTRDNVYHLKVPQLRTGLEDYILRIHCTGDGGGDSTGVFTLKQK